MSAENPYAPPSSDILAPASPPRTDQLATTGQRLLNLLLDYVGVTVVAFAVGLVLAIAAPGNASAALLDSWGFGIGLVLAYYAVSEGVFARTPAKLITGTRVVGAGGAPPTAGQIARRTLVRMVPFEPFSFLGGNGRPVGWHDAWSDTRVVRTRGREPAA